MIHPTQPKTVTVTHCAPRRWILDPARWIGTRSAGCPVAAASGGPADSERERPYNASSSAHASKIVLLLPSERLKEIQASSVSQVRNFSIIAHVDHGKSSVSDAILRRLGSIDPRTKAQFLDSLEVESTRGITIRARTCSLLFRRGSGDSHVLNLIDTPGHADFSFEVKRSLCASDGCVLLVDASQGPQAQTFSHLQKARDRGLPIIPVLNKVDLIESSEQLKELKKTVGDLVGASPEAVLEVSAKTGQGIDELLDTIVRELPPPSACLEASKDGPLKALVFDSFYDPSKGVVLVAVVRDGMIKAGDAVTAIRSQFQMQIREVGLMLPERHKTDRLVAGQVGYICSNLKKAADIHVGDTLCLSQARTEPLPGFEPPKRLVYAGVYPEDPSGYEKLKVALQRLVLTDAAVEMKPSISQALGHGFRCGFLGALHMEVVHQRLEAEFGQRTVLASPSVTFLLESPDGSRLPIENPSQLPKGRHDVLEPLARVTVVTPMVSMAAVDRLVFARRGERLEYHVQQQPKGQQDTRSATIRLVYRVPLAEILVDFSDKLQSATSGTGTYDVEDAGYEPARVSVVSFLVNGQPVDALGLIAHQSQARTLATRFTERLADLIPPQQFEIAVQGAVDGRVVAKSRIRALRKDVTAKCYGGDVTRKLKLLNKQKEGKKRMKAIGNVQIPSSAFLGLLKLRD
ncbi:uncharacterized protein LOC34619235 [Cyclospora cayetanensis]|uniref:Translation factor GUF1 homolog, mitochondrial n=1 Tax=Cyclospora cayetanensis TaxID=88456 RepID=A0A6P6RS62_9EIME|nr:uncharacterized protein LOC34619235 [Cyclospora cayetanensis]